MSDAQLATPLAIVETYFDVRLDKSGLKKLDKVNDQAWIDFSHHYASVMRNNFAPQFLDPLEATQSVRLFFEPRMSDEWQQSVAKLQYPATPLLGVRSSPEGYGEINEHAVSQMLAPLKKHLLMADSVYVQDTFYKVFDIMADHVSRDGWRSSPASKSILDSCIPQIRRWLPILAELRPLIDSRALVFTPYYATPSFPYAANSPALKQHLARVRVVHAPWYERPKSRGIDVNTDWSQPSVPPEQVGEPDPVEVRRWIDKREVLGAWLNARVLGLDPVFPNRPMFDIAAGYYFEDEAAPEGMTSDLISMDVLPFGHAADIKIKDLVEIRKNEDVFVEVREAVGACKEYIAENVSGPATRDAMTNLSKGYLQDRLDRLERRSVLKFLDSNPIAGIAYSLAFGAAFLPAVPVLGGLAPAIPLIAGAVFTPQIAQLVAKRFNHEGRAVSHLLALL